MLFVNLHSSLIRIAQRNVENSHLRVLIVSMGALHNGPVAPEMRPITIC